MKYHIVLFLILGLSTSSYAKDCGKLGSELINLSFQMHQEFEKTKSANAVMKKYNSQLNQKIDALGKFGDAHPKCRKELEAAASEAAHQLQDIQKQAKTKDTKEPQQNIEAFNHATLKERLDIGPNLIVGRIYKVTSLYGELYDGLCKPMVHRGGKELCDDAESLMKNIQFDFSTQDAKTKFYRNKKSIGCFTFVWTDYNKLRITDYQVGSCN